MVNRIRATLRSALNTALRDGLVAENPAALLVMPAAGVELKVVQEMLGHSSIVLTADTYTSVLPKGRSHRR